MSILLNTAGICRAFRSNHFPSFNPHHNKYRQVLKETPACVMKLNTMQDIHARKMIISLSLGLNGRWHIHSEGLSYPMRPKAELDMKNKCRQVFKETPACVMALNTMQDIHARKWKSLAAWWWRKTKSENSDFFYLSRPWVNLIESRWLTCKLLF